ncbi:MAG: response regulator transcription factor [Archaeoglobaceae archaeon]
MTKIMIVDDSGDIRESLKALMEKEGYETHLAFNGEEFVGKVEEVQPDLVLLDVMMPGLSTSEILDRLKERKMDSLKIVLITVVRFSEEEIQQLMSESSIVDYIIKPFDVVDVSKRVSTALSSEVENERN